MALSLVAIAAMSLGYLATQKEISVTVDGQNLRLRTHQMTVGAVLGELGIAVHPEDVVIPGVEAQLQSGEAIWVEKAKTVYLEFDGISKEMLTRSSTVGELLGEASIQVGGADRVFLNEEIVDLGTPLISDLPPSIMHTHLFRNRTFTSQPLRVSIQRALPISVNDGGLPTFIHTLAPTVGEALSDQNIFLHLGDKVMPELGTRITSGIHIYIQRSVPVTIVADGRTIKTRTREETVEATLSQEDIVLHGKDYTKPGGDAAIRGDMTVEIIRVDEKLFIEEEPIRFETAWEPDHQMELDQQRVERDGQDGVMKRRIRSIYENGEEKQRLLEREWVDADPTAKIIAYGTNIVSRQMDTPEGPISYWRKFRVLATSYSAATSGKSPDHPQYGITFLGWEAGKGIVAVDPNVINLASQMYIPGYGMAAAGDTGGRIKGLRVDLGFDEDDLELWYSWVDVYLLDPPPSSDEIRWVLPNWPQERRRP
jgi:uncharacterized protein YabE (DUF348 family)